MNRTPEDVISNPVLFLKPDSALHKKGNPFFIPDFSNNIHYEAEVVVKINRLGKNIAERFAHRYYDQITIGLDLTARDLQDELKAKRLPWEISKGFDNSAVTGEFISTTDVNLKNLNFRLEKNGETVQTGNTSEMLHSIDKIISYASQFFTLKIGDLIYTGTPQGVGPVNIGDHLTGFIEDKKLLTLSIN